MMTWALHKAGFRTTEASSADEGMRRLRTVTPDVVLLDVVMPEMTGWTLLGNIKKDAALQSIPVIVVSILEDRDHSLALGAVDHLLKPVEADRLVAAVRSARLGNTRPMEAVES